MKGGARRKTRSSDPPPPPHPVKNETDDQVNDQVQLGKRNRKKEQQQRRPMNDGRNDHDEEENEDHEDNDGQINGDQERPMLAEGFYEIEAVRKKRTRKGVKQYLIKCMNSVKRKRKRKHAISSISQSKKKQKQMQDSPDPAYPMPSEEPRSGPDPCVHNSNMTENNVKVANDDGTNNQSNEWSGKLSEMNQENMTEFAIHIQEDPVKPANGVSKVDETDGTEVRRASPRIGARRRKSCAVKRFKQESNSSPRKDATKKTKAAGDVIVQDDTIKSDDDMVNGLDSGNVLKMTQSVPVITKIVKPVNYTVTILNDMEDVCVSFLVTRSDGEEIVVDNKFLKENNPVLLINYYEQHLRYNSPSE